jgi:predicted nuclease of predicted toxin-antitoxin system
VKFWVDSQLPPLLATWLSEQFNVEAFSLRTLGLSDATDATIFQAAQQQGIVIVSKDSDFVELISRYGPPPQLIWATCGNVTNRQLQIVFNKIFPASLELLAAGQVMVEIG